MSLKNWINKIEASQLNEFAPPQGSVAIPGIQGQGQGQNQVSATFLAPTNANDKATADLIKALASNKKITTIGQQQPAAGTKTNTPQQQQQQTPQQTVAGTTMGGDLQEDDIQDGSAYPDGSSIKTPGADEWKEQYQQAVMAVKNAKTQQEYEAASDRAGRIKDLLASKGIKVGPVLGEGTFGDKMKDNKQSIMEGTLEEILGNHPHEALMFREGWGMDNSLYEALCDHYFKEGRIPRSVWHGSAEELRKHVEDCYTQDTMVVGEGLGGAVAGGTIGAAVGGPVGALRGASIGSGVQDMMSEKGMMESTEQSEGMAEH
jgi:hypothetical protein